MYERALELEPGLAAAHHGWDVETGDLERLPIAGLRAIVSAGPPVSAPDLAELDDRHWAEARRRLDLIKPVRLNSST